MKRAVHVLQRGDKWIVKMAGASRAYRVYKTRQEALDKGKEMATRNKTERLLHRADGSIMWKDTFPEPPLW